MRGLAAPRIVLCWSCHVISLSLGESDYTYYSQMDTKNPAFSTFWDILPLLPERPLLTPNN